MLDLLKPIMVYVPDLSIEGVETELRKIYQQSDELHFEYKVGKFLMPGWSNIKHSSFINKLKELNQQPDNLKFADLINEQNDSLQIDQEFYNKVARLAEQLEDLWGKLD
jgi:hypothetical protein